ncbi:MAG: WYL domain-containing protein [Acidimicrobiia bacterium]|nr:WYL domain-containing protein [Acidimicrobiia bacterium]
MKTVIQRLLNLLAFLLTVGRPVSADEIRHTVAGYGQDSDETFRRMFERDKDLLRSLGIPLSMAATDHWEVEFGYVVPPEDYRLDDPGLADDELAALGLAAHAVRVGSTAPGPGALFKLGGSPAQVAGEPLAANLGADADVIADMFGAVQEHRLVTFEYRDKKRRLEPYGLVHRRGHWYVLGPARGETDVRAYRLDRATKVTVGADVEAFERPAGFKAATALSDAPWDAGSDDVQATVIFDAEGAWWAERQLTSAAVVTRLGSEGSIEVTLPVANRDAFIGWLIGFDDHAEVTGPPELRAQVLARVRGEA